jgi:lipid-A-disaccharide synthase
VQNPQCRERLTAIIAEQAPNLPIHIIDGQSRQVMAAADAVLLASGTATLEAMLIKRPMVIAYRLGAVSYRVGKLLIKIPYIGLPNLLAGKQLVPEFIQHQVCPELLAEQLLKLLANEQLTDELTREFTRLHRQLRCQASATTARVLLELIASNPTHSDN